MTIMINISERESMYHKMLKFTLMLVPKVNNLPSFKGAYGGAKNRPLYSLELAKNGNQLIGITIQWTYFFQ